MKKIIFGTLLFFMVVSFAPIAKAVSLDDLMAQIQDLKTEVRGLKATISANAYTGTRENTAPVAGKKSMRRLSKGVWGSDVTEMQNKLKNQGYFTGESTGYYGEATSGAVKNCQHAHGLPETGEIDDTTAQAIDCKGTLVKNKNNTYSCVTTTTGGTSTTNTQLSPAGGASGTTTTVPPVKTNLGTTNVASPNLGCYPGLKYSKITGALCPQPTSVGFLSHFANRKMGKGASGTDVSNIQTMLKSRGYFSGEVTGYYGDATTGAVKGCQHSHGLPETGEVDDTTATVITCTGTLVKNKDNTYSCTTSGTTGGTGTDNVQLSPVGTTGGTTTPVSK